MAQILAADALDVWVFNSGNDIGIGIILLAKWAGFDPFLYSYSWRCYRIDIVDGGVDGAGIPVEWNGP